MKSRYIKLTGCVWAMLMLASCASDTLPEIKETPFDLTVPVVANVSGEIAGLRTETRSADNPNISDGVFPKAGAFKDGSDAYICVTPVSYADGTAIEPEILALMKDKKYRSNANGVFEPATPSDSIRFYNDKPVKFMAYYPYHLINGYKFIEFGPFLPPMLTPEIAYHICTGNNKYYNSGDNILLEKWTQKSNSTTERNVYYMKTMETEFQDRFTDVLRTKEVVASAKDPNIRFTGENSFQHRMAKINVILDTSWNNYEFIDGVLQSENFMLEVTVFPHKSLCSYSAAEDSFSFAPVDNPELGVNQEISMRQTNPDEFSKSAKLKCPDGSLLDVTRVGYITDTYKVPQILIAPQTVDVYFKFVIRTSINNGGSIETTVRRLNTNTLNFTFEKGKEYTFTIAVSGDKTIISGCAISDWHNGISVNGRMEAF